QKINLILLPCENFLARLGKRIWHYKVFSPLFTLIATIVRECRRHFVLRSVWDKKLKQSKNEVTALCQKPKTLDKTLAKEYNDYICITIFRR
ncbi:MAG: hypothetical protein IJC69_02410, partial [Clostridia bacterium]|nr:hypothetical protein [Clostridia bacterium]